MMPATRNHYSKIIVEPAPPYPALKAIPDVWVNIAYKCYPRFRQIPLDVDFKQSGTEMFNVIRSRQTRRDFAKNAHLSFSVFSDMLYYSAGVRDFRSIMHSATDMHNPAKAKRMYASGGARYPIEVYVIANNIAGLKKGVYHYNARDNTLEMLLLGNMARRNILVDAKKNRLQKATAVVILTAVLPRNEVKYLELGYALAWEEAGRVGCMLSLIAQNYNLGCCPVAGIYHNEIIGLLNIDPEEEIPLMAHALGKCMEGPK